MRWEAFAEACPEIATIGWAPDEPEFHLFSIDVEAAGYTVFGEGSYALTRTPAAGLRRLPLH